METGRVKMISRASVEGAMNVIVIVVNLNTALISYLITPPEMNFVQILLPLLFPYDVTRKQNSALHCLT